MCHVNKSNCYVIVLLCRHAWRGSMVCGAGAAKRVNFDEKKLYGVRFKSNVKKVLEIKKNPTQSRQRESCRPLRASRSAQLAPPRAARFSIPLAATEVAAVVVSARLPCSAPGSWRASRIHRALRGAAAGLLVTSLGRHASTCKSNWGKNGRL